jgi:hypothetical protein
MIITEKKVSFLIGSLFLVQLLFAQVGINTKNPLGVFHIDPKGNTNGTIGIDDDIIVDANGNLGIGTTTPKAKVDIIGGIIIKDGTQAKDKVLTSDANGKASWQYVKRNQQAVWSLTNSSVTFTHNTDVRLTGTSSISENAIGLKQLADSRIEVPAGAYLIIVNHDVWVAEYGVFRIGVPGVGAIYNIYYKEQLTGAAFIYKFNTPTTIQLLAAYRNLSSSITRYKAPPFTSGFSTSIRFISLH